MQRPNISVIVPVYKTQEYINRCIESIVSQSLSDFELILIDDGSPDDCGRICDEWACLDERIKVIHQSNQGVSVARNTGIENSSCQYLFFCDSDDIIPKFALEKLYKQIQNGFDMATGYFEYDVTDKSRNLRNIRKNIITKTLIIKDDFAKEFDNAWNSVNFMSCDGKLFKKKIIEENKIRFNSELIVFEDFDFVLSYLDKINSMIVIDSYIYSVFCEKTDAPHALNRSRLDYVDDYIKGDEKLKVFLKKRDIDYSEQYWRTIRANLQIAYDALWSIPVHNKQDKKKKLLRISEVLKLPHIQHLIDYQEFIYPRLEYYLLKRGNAFKLDKYYRIQKRIKKYFI